MTDKEKLKALAYEMAAERDKAADMIKEFESIHRSRDYWLGQRVVLDYFLGIINEVKDDDATK